MAIGGLRRYDVQAKYAVVLSVGSAVPMVAAAILALRNYNHDLGQIIYGSPGPFLPTFFACLGISLLAGTIASALGLSSAGQRRNDKPVRAWVGFFVGSSVVAGNVILLIAYWMLKLPHHV